METKLERARRILLRGTIQWMPRSEMRPQASALERYLAVFPWRYVRWNAARQLFEIRERTPLGEDFRQGFARLTLEPGWHPFDHRFVTQRLRERWEVLELGREEVDRRRHERNQRLALEPYLRLQAEKNYWARHERRYLAEIAENDRLDRLDPRPVARRNLLPVLAPSRAKHLRSPLVAVGA